MSSIDTRLYPACLTFSPLSDAPSEILAADHLPETALTWELLCKAEMSVLPRLDGSTGFEFCFSCVVHVLVSKLEVLRCRQV